MSIFSRFPYTDFHRLNADWILEKIKEMLGLTQQAAETVEGYDDRLTAAETAVAGAVRFDRVQDLTALQQGQARDNIQAAPANMFGAVRYDQVQLLEAPQKARARSNIGAAEAGVIPSGVVRYDEEQSLTDNQKTLARSNIGAAEAGVVPSGVVRYDQQQNLTTLQQGQARDNIQAAPADMFGAVRYDQVQLLEEAQKTRARSNIGAAEAGVIPSGVLRYDVEQSLTDAQTEQARENINVLASVIREEIVTGNTPTIDLTDLVDGTAYETVIQCTGSAITAVTISYTVMSNLLVTIVFTTGSTAPTFDSPLTIRGLDDLVPEANTTYEISIRGNRAAWKAWEVTT